MQEFDNVSYGKRLSLSRITVNQYHQGNPTVKNSILLHGYPICDSLSAHKHPYTVCQIFLNRNKTSQIKSFHVQDSGEMICFHDQGLNNTGDTDI